MNSGDKKKFNHQQNKIFFGGNDRLEHWLNDGKSHEEIIDKVRMTLKNYLELDNVSFLFGTGTSLHLGAASIRNFPLEVEEHVKSEGLASVLYAEIEALQSDLVKEEYEKILDALAEMAEPNNEENDEEKRDEIEEVDEPPRLNFEFTDSRGWEFIVQDSIVRDKESGEIAIEYEKVLNYLIAYDYVLTQKQPNERTDKIKDLIVAIKEGLFEVCNVDKRTISASQLEKINARGKEEAFKNALNNKYYFHQMFLKALLQRPLNLRRANIFTTNYDLAFEYAFDRLGIHYIDGFSGFHKRFFKPETFDYDLFFPGSTTSGKVQRIEKVVRYFKLHGSLSWVNSEKRDANNLYGIEEKTLDVIEKLQKKGEIIIYPSAVKKSYTLDLPYSELFRQFASAITCSQSVLITVGYSFFDEHLNDIIYQTLSNPTFTLIIVDFNGTENSEIKRLKELNDPRIIVLEGEFFGDFLTLADTLMPNFHDVNQNEEIARTMDKILRTNVESSNPEKEQENEK